MTGLNSQSSRFSRRGWAFAFFPGGADAAGHHSKHCSSSAILLSLRAMFTYHVTPQEDHTLHPLLPTVTSSNPSVGVTSTQLGFPGAQWWRIWLSLQEMPGLISGSERSPGGGNGNPLQYSGLGNPRKEEPGGLPSTGSQNQTHHSTQPEPQWIRLPPSTPGLPPNLFTPSVLIKNLSSVSPPSYYFKSKLKKPKCVTWT